MILTTGMAVEGQPVKEYLDVVTSQAIMGVHVGRDIKALGRSIIGGRSGTYEEEFAEAVCEAKDELRRSGETRCRRRHCGRPRLRAGGRRDADGAASGTAVQLA